MTVEGEKRMNEAETEGRMVTKPSTKPYITIQDWSTAMDMDMEIVAFWSTLFYSMQSNPIP